MMQPISDADHDQRVDESSAIRAAVAANMRRIRLVQAISLRELSVRTGVSKALLSQIERSVGNPTVVVLAKIADALQVTFGELTRPSVAPLEVVRATARSDESGARMLFSTNERRRFDVSEGVLVPGGAGVLSDHGRGSMEYAYIVAGAVELTIGGQVIRLDAGDSVRFGSEVEHVYSAVGSAATLLTVVSYVDE